MPSRFRHDPPISTVAALVGSRAERTPSPRKKNGDTCASLAAIRQARSIGYETPEIVISDGRVGVLWLLETPDRDQGGRAEGIVLGQGGQDERVPNPEP